MKVLLLHGPMLSIKKQKKFSCSKLIKDTIIKYSELYDLIYIATWDTENTSEIEPYVGSKVKLDKLKHPSKLPFSSSPENPSRNMYLQAFLVWSACDYLSSNGYDYVVKIRTDMEFINLGDLFYFLNNIESNKLYVKAFRPCIPCVFGDGILIGQATLLSNLFYEQFFFPQKFDNVHYNIFYNLACALQKIGLIENINFPHEFALNNSKFLTNEQLKCILYIWSSHIRLIPESILFPWVWRGELQKKDNNIEIYSQKFNSLTLQRSLTRSGNIPKLLAPVMRNVRIHFLMSENSVVSIIGNWMQSCKRVYVRTFYKMIEIRSKWILGIQK